MTTSVAQPQPQVMQTASTSGPPPMRLWRFRVRQFRGIEDATIELGETTVIMGENNSGKSALLEACGVAFGERQATTADLRVDEHGRVASEFKIDLEFRPWDGTQFDPSVTDVMGAMVRTEPVTATQRYFIRVIGRPDFTNRVIEMSRFFSDDWDVSDGSLVTPVTIEQRSELWCAVLDARRDLVEELRHRSSPWAKLLRRLQLSDPDRARFQAQLQQLSDSISGALPSAAALAGAVANLQSVLGGQVSNARLAVLPTALEDVWRTTDLLVTASNNPELSISRQGLGARSLSSLLAFRAWLESEVGGRPERPLLVVTAFEEPEAHLHPQAQRAVFEEISRVSGQKIISTHSPYFASVGDIDDFRVIRRAPGVVVQSARGIRLSSGVDHGALENIRRFCLLRNADMLFARLVILCEGDTDAGVLPELARAWYGCSPSQVGISIVPMEGAGNAVTFARLLTWLGVRWIMIVDGDQAGHSAKKSISNDGDLSPYQSNVFLLYHNGNWMNIEGVIAHAAPVAVANTFGQTPQHVVALQAKTPQELAEQLAGAKGVLSRRLGLHLAQQWPTRSLFAPTFADAFSRADQLLGWVHP